MANELAQPQVPQALEAEIAVIGSIFMEPSIMVTVRDSVNPDDFYEVKNKIIYQTMVTLFESGKSIDVTSVMANLKLNDKLETAGGYDYISTIANYSYSSSNIETYLDLITSSSMKRRAIATLQDLIQDGYKPGEGTGYIDTIEKKVFDLSRHRKTSSFVSIREVTKRVEENTERQSKTDSEVIGLDTGFTNLNRYTQGFQPGQLIILAARPAMGKSAMALNLAMNIAEINNQNVAVFSLEMSSEQLVQRMVAATGSINIKYIMNGRMTKSDWVRFASTLDKVANMHVFFDDSSDTTVENIRAKCRKLKQESGLGLIVIDYLQLIEYDNQGSSRAISQVEKITRITRTLKVMARELEVPVIVLSQLSRKVEERDEKKPIMSDLRDSGSIEQDADIVLMLYRDEYYNKSSPRKGEADFIIGKNRSGSTGEIKMIFAGEYQRFREKKEDEEVSE